MLLAPLAALPLGVAAAIWTLASLAAILAVPRMLARLSGVPLREQALPWLAVLTYVLDAFALGQAEPINLFLVTWGLVLARGTGPTAGAVLIGFAGMIKVLPVVFWGVLAARGRLAAAALGAGLTVAASAVLLVVAAGWGPGLHSIAEWIAVLREGEGPWGLVATQNSLRENNEALPVVLARTFGDLDPDLTRNAVSLARLPLRIVWAIWLAMLAAMGAVWLLSAWRARLLPPERAWLGMFALTSPLMLAATHIAWPHYFVVAPAHRARAPRAPAAPRRDGRPRTARHDDSRAARPRVPHRHRPRPLRAGRPGPARPPAVIAPPPRTCGGG